MIVNPLRHPYYKPTVVLARACANIATLIWSIVVVIQKDALVTAHTSYAWIDSVVPEDLIAWCFGMVALSQTAWLLLCLPPVRFGSIGYGVQAFSWTFVWISMLMATPIPPTGAACVPIIAGLAIYGFISNPRRDNGCVAP